MSAISDDPTYEGSAATRPPEARTARPDDGARHRLRPGLALTVIATTQLMVVLDATIINVALPRMQGSLHFSGNNLEWVVNAYALAFGGLLLLGGRSGDLLGRRRIFISGILLFTVASLLGGLAQDQAWLLAARVAQGAGAAFAAPTALSLVAINFPEGKQRNRAMAVYAAMSVGGGAFGLVLGGLLTSYASWRWVLLVNVPIGLVVAALAPIALRESAKRRGNFDIPGALTATLGCASLVYGLSNAAAGQDGVSHWGDTKVVVSLAAAAVLLIAFVLVEARSAYPLLPFRVLRSRDRSGANLMMLLIGTQISALFFFLSVFAQEVLGYSPLKTGFAYLPMVAMILVGSAAASQLVPRIGARPLMIIGSVIACGGMVWFAQLNEHSGYADGLLGPMMVAALGMGLMFVPISLVSLSKVADNDTGVASSLLNTGQQIGGSIGLAVLGTVAWSLVAKGTKGGLGLIAQRAAAAAKLGHPLPAAQLKMAQQEIVARALSQGFSHAYYGAAMLALLVIVVAVLAIRVTREDLEGVNPMSAPS